MWLCNGISGINDTCKEVCQTPAQIPQKVIICASGYLRLAIIALIYFWHINSLLDVVLTWVRLGCGLSNTRRSLQHFMDQYCDIVAFSRSLPLESEGPKSKVTRLFSYIMCTCTTSIKKDW